jgi:hypothetical protein
VADGVDAAVARDEAPGRDTTVDGVWAEPRIEEL